MSSNFDRDVSGFIWPIWSLTYREFMSTVDGQTLRRRRQRQMMRNAANTRNKTGPTLKRPRARPSVHHHSFIYREQICKSRKGKW